VQDLLANRTARRLKASKQGTNGTRSRFRKGFYQSALTDTAEAVMRAGLYQALRLLAPPPHMLIR
jgi:hypothetical protein